MRRPSPGRVLRLAVVAWGLGHLSMGRRLSGAAWLGTEAVALAAVAASTLLFADTTWYLIPFLLGMAFIAGWMAQAVLAYRAALRLHGAIPPTERRSPAAAAAWLTLPLLAWGTGFWLIGAGAATPAAVVDRFVSGWQAATSAADGRPYPAGWPPAEDPRVVEGAALAAVDRLRDLCAAGLPAESCAAGSGLLRDVRVRISVAPEGDAATAVAELVRYERRPSRIFGLVTASELVPVPLQRILTLQLAARPAALGGARWTIVNAQPG